uniref:Ikbip protein n=1 Tax=Fopius arisanus TaxID=64838 RepID=A0A0C9PNB7_9HYME
MDISNQKGKSRRSLLTLREARPELINSARESSSSISCIFPCYRTGHQPEDAVLVKDIGISCEILKGKPPGLNEKSSIEYIFTRRIKAEYSELSVVTSKLTSYTKNMIKNIHSKKNMKFKPSESHVKRGEAPLAEEYLDENGRACLKLRLQSPLNK